MMRIKLPPFCIDFILDFFIQRKNAIFTANGITDYYNVKIEIDQGEIISPLLWCIYFDPLLCKINDLDYGYTLSHTQITDVISNSYFTSSLQISSLSFMDDTNWISDSQDYLESILQIADEFYDLTRATINKYKSCLLTNITRKSHLILIKFSSNTISIPPFFDSVRFLDVLININLKRSLIKKDLKQHIQQFVRLICYKLITDR